MAEDAVAVMRRFWEIQNDRDYVRLVGLFADDAVLEDPIYGTYRGRDAILGFMQKMNTEMGGQNISFDLVELAGGGDAAWAKWVARTPRGDRHGVGIYKVASGQVTYYRDYMDPSPSA